MGLITSLLVFFVLCFEFVQCVDRGVQLRITKKAMEYALDIELQKLQQNIKTQTFDQSGKSGDVKWEVSRTKIKELSFPSKSLQPVSGQGIKASIVNGYIKIDGNVHYKFKKSWLISISDSIDVTIKARNIRFDFLVNVGRDSNGRPTISTRSCSSDLDVDIDFHGGKAFIYNLFSRIFERKLKDVLKDAICKSARKGIDEDAQKSLATFPVTKQIDKWALVDYSLSSDLLYTQQYLDIYLKGEFKDAKNPVEIGEPFTPFTTGFESDRMLYVWLSEYTANTAGETYHRTGRLVVDVNGWDSEDKEHVRDSLNTKNLKLYAPKFFSQYPNAPIGLHITSFKSPRLEISTEGMKFYVYARVLFRVKFNGKIVDVFGVNFYIHATVSIKVHENKIIPQINPGFTFRADIDKGFKDMILASLNSRFVYGMLYRIIMVKVNKKLERGLDIPKLNDIDLKNVDMETMKGAVKLGCDVSLKA